MASEEVKRYLDTTVVQYQPKGYFVEHVRMRECTCVDLMGCPKTVDTLIYTKEEYDRLMLDFPCMTIVRDEWADRKT